MIVFLLCKTGVYSLCDGRGLSYGPYVGITVLCSLASAAVVALKAWAFGASVVIDGERFVYHRNLQQQNQSHQHGVWQVMGMQVMLFCSLVLALGHIAAAYRTRSKERKKLLFYRIDPEAVCLSLPLSSVRVCTGRKRFRQQNRCKFFTAIIGFDSSIYMILKTGVCIRNRTG